MTAYAQIFSKPALRWTLAITVFWALVTLVTAQQLYELPAVQDSGISFWFVLARQTVFWFVWAAFTGLAIAAARAFPLHGTLPMLTQRAAVHLCAMLGVILLHLLIRLAWRRFMPDGELAGVPASFYRAGRSVAIVIDALLYWAIVAGYSALSFYRRLRQHELHTAHLETQLAEARLAALRMQINPHFLFNALNSISTLVREIRTKEAVKALSELGSLLRTTLDESLTKGDVSLLRDELAFLDRYIALEQLRFHERLLVMRDIEPDVAEALVPTLILQPLVENAIKHGIGGRIEAGLLIITAHKRNGKLVVSIEDDGAGLPPHWSERPRYGVGLSNVRERLQTLYADRATLALEPRTPTGTKVTLAIPLQG
jgi:signal transduction histidine kinase